MVINEKLVSINDNKIARFTMDIRLSDNITKTKEGYLLCKNVVMGRTGYQKYLGNELVGLGFNANEIVEVFRGENEVFHDITLDSAIGKPVTKGHPNVDVTVDNIKRLGKGYILGRPNRIGDDMVGDIMITDEELVYLVESKKLRDLSLGYQAKLVRDGDLVRQEEIFINHLAVVEFGRAGNALIIDEDTTRNKEVNVLDKLKEQGITININLADLMKKEEETKKEKDEDKVDDKLKAKDEDEEKDKDKDTKADDEDKVEDENNEDEDKVDDEEEKEVKDKETKNKDKKEDKGDVKDMDIKTLLAQLSTLSDEDKKSLSQVLNVGDAGKETKNAFNDVKPVNNTQTLDVKDYSQIKGDEKEKAMQKFHDDNFSFRAMYKKANGDSQQVKRDLYMAKDIDTKDLTGGNR